MGVFALMLECSGFECCVTLIFGRGLGILPNFCVFLCDLGGFILADGNQILDYPRESSKGCVTTNLVGASKSNTRLYRYLDRTTLRSLLRLSWRLMTRVAL